MIISRSDYFFYIFAGARNHHRQHQHHNMGPPHHHQHGGFRGPGGGGGPPGGPGPGGNGYQHSQPKFYDPCEIYNLLPPPEYLRNMPPPMHNHQQLPIPKLPCLEPYNNENNGGIPNQQNFRPGPNPRFYPQVPALWRPPVPPMPPPTPPHFYRGRPPMQQQPPMMASQMTSTRHFM